MRDQGQDEDIDNGLRLEDISRLSACDRCRGMKTRCERSHHRGIAQLQQCRRCWQAEFLKLGSVDEQHHTTLLEHQSEHIATEMPSLSSVPAGSTAEDGLLPSHETDFQWHESKMVDPEGGAMHNLDHNQTSATDGPPTSDVTVSFANHTPDSRTSMDAMTSIPEATQFNQTPQQSDNLVTNRSRGDEKSMMVKTLQHSDIFLELLGVLSRPRYAPDCSSSYLGGTTSRHAGSTKGRGEKIDTDMALQLLSCNMNLTTQDLQLEEAQTLPALRLEGLENLDVEIRVQVLKELNLIRQRGLLSKLQTPPSRLSLGTEIAGLGALRLVWNRS
ncbi:uncharacterized protein K441DRAFT_683308 [Cenococcum geophilum 1.58]|uniref:uncharacterized protein n=1 Tax=Cenococcum geophilum 1.58 TaxID=794803 RepID=UPI0035902A25|nr:hypothetical protein K441DRAFT_683308 [Cenococcum geophilum 1.58]